MKLSVMKKVVEEYVSYRVAELLKRAGYPQDRTCNSNVNIIPYYKEGDFNLYFNDIGTIFERPEFISAPTQQSAMRWLREVHNLHIYVFYSTSTNSNWCFEIIDLSNLNTIITYSKHCGYTCEQCIDEALYYILSHDLKLS